MSVSAKLVEFLDQKHVPYVTQPHPRAYTAQETAAAIHVPGWEVAKTVIVRADGQFMMAVVPATRRIDLDRLRTAVGASQIRLATEVEFGDLFPECETGAMPPFGNLYHVPVIVDDSLKKDREIVFNAGSHTETIRMAFDEFTELVRPIFGSFTERPA